MRTLIVLGGGGHAAVVTEAAIASGLPVAGFLDDDPSVTLHHLAPRLGSLSALSRRELFAGHAVILGVGELGLREKLLRLGGDLDFAVVVHPSAVVSTTASLGAGAFIGARAVVQTGASVGAHAIVNTGAVLEHDSVLSERAHLAPGAVTGGNVRIGPGVLVGLGACVIPGVEIGGGAVVGAGSVVIRSVDPGSVMAGSPARAIEGHRPLGVI